MWWWLLGDVAETLALRIALRESLYMRLEESGVHFYVQVDTDIGNSMPTDAA